MPKIIILGASGFVGKYLYQHLCNNTNFEVKGFSSSEIDLTSKNDLDMLTPILNKNTCLILASAITPDKENSINSMLQNITMISNVCNFVNHHEIRQIIYLSSTDVYGDRNDTLAITENTETHQDSYYAISKFTGELILNQTCLEHNIPLTILRLGGIYGPGDTHDSPIKNFIHSAINHNYITVYGDGSDLRDYIYIDDIYNVVREIISNRIVGTYNVASGKSYPIIQIVQLLENIFRMKLDKHFLKRNRKLRHLVFDVSLFKKKLPDIKLTPLDDGLKRTYEYYHQEKAS